MNGLTSVWIQLAAVVLMSLFVQPAESAEPCAVAHRRGAVDSDRRDTAGLANTVVYGGGHRRPVFVRTKRGRTLRFPRFTLAWLTDGRDKVVTKKESIAPAASHDRNGNGED